MESAVAIVNTAEYEGMPNIFLEGWSRGVPALSLFHDPDGVIAGEGVGGFARGSQERFQTLARMLWESRFDQSELAARSRDYIARHHAIDVVVDRWVEVVEEGRR
jgi:hypothetical protein